MELNIIEALAKAMAPALASQLGLKGATGTPTSYLMHGPGGLFATAGVDQAILSTHVRPTGLLEVLPANGTPFTNPLFTFVTGFLADTGSNPSGPCDNCITAGVKKACTVTAQFGRYCRETKEIDITRIGKLINRGEPTDLRLVNPVFAGNALTPAGAQQDPLKDEVAQAIVEVGISFERLLSRQLWIGDPTNNNLGGGYREFPGLTTLVGTGKVDALTGTSCPSLNSDVKDYAYQDVCSGSPSIVEVLSYMFRYISKIARTTGMDPVDLRWVMREELFYELTSCWPCSYMTFRCNTNTGPGTAQEIINQSDALGLRDAMRNGRYLLVDGKQIPVVLDDGIPEDTNVNNANLQPGQFASDIYLLPFSAKGFQTLYLEYYDYRESQRQMASAPMDWSQDYLVTDGGKFAWTKSRINYCWKLLATIEPRILLRTPHLAGRLQHVRYQPLQHTREPFPTDGYFVDGGRTSTTVPSFYSEWAD